MQIAAIGPGAAVEGRPDYERLNPSVRSKTSGISLISRRIRTEIAGKTKVKLARPVPYHLDQNGIDRFRKAAYNPCFRDKLDRRV